MQARRPTGSRLTVVAVLGVLALAGLGACRADRSVAAYVDDVPISEAELDEAMADYQAILDAQAGGVAPTEDPGQTGERAASFRRQLVGFRILTEAGHGYLAAEGLAAAEPDLDRVATQVGLAPDSALVRVVAEYLAVETVLRDSVEPVAPTETDQREVYDNLVDQGLTVPPFEEARAALTEEVLGGPVALRDLLVAVRDRAEIQLNPRYQPVHRVLVPVRGAQSWLSVPLGDPAVVEAG